MTLIVALACRDGIVMGADSASTDPTTETKTSVIKIQRLGKNPIIFGGAGDLGLIQKVMEALDELTIPTSAKFSNARRLIRQTCLPLLREAAETHIRHFIPGYETPPTASLLFACIHKKSPFILEIDADGRDTVYDKNLGYFRAIGRGTAVAQAVMHPHLTTERDLELGKILAYRILEDSIELSATGLAKPIHLYTLKLDGALSELEDGELVNLKKLRELWRDLERETLGKLLAPAEPPTPLPEPDNNS